MEELTNNKLLILVFQDESGAERSVETLRSAQKEQISGVQAAVAIIKDQNSKIRYKDVGITPAKGATGGILVGAALGILSGGATIALGALGALIGGLIGEQRRAGQFSDVRMNEVVASLTPGTSAIVAIVESEHLPEIEKELHAFEAEFFTAEMTADLAEKLEAQHHASYSAWRDELDE